MGIAQRHGGQADVKAGHGGRITHRDRRVKVLKDGRQIVLGFEAFLARRRKGLQQAFGAGRGLAAGLPQGPKARAPVLLQNRLAGFGQHPDFQFAAGKGVIDRGGLGVLGARFGKDSGAERYLLDGDIGQVTHAEARIAFRIAIIGNPLAPGFARRLLILAIDDADVIVTARQPVLAKHRALVTIPAAGLAFAKEAGKKSELALLGR